MVQIRCKRGKTELIQCYRVLVIFSKHYSKWYVHWQSDSILFDKDSKNFKFLVRMVQKDEGDVKEVDLKEDGLWGPKFVYIIKHMCDIADVISELEARFEW